MEAQEIEPDLVTYSLWISAHKKRLGITSSHSFLYFVFLFIFNLMLQDKQNPSAVQTDAIHKMEDNQTVTNKTRDELKPVSLILLLSLSFSAHPLSFNSRLLFFDNLRYSKYTTI